MEPSHWPTGAHYFGHYALGHNMTKTVRVVNHVRTINGLRQSVRVEIPVHCRRCGLVDDADLMRDVCTRETPEFTTIALEMEISGERAASEVVQRVVGDAVVWTERGVIA